MTAGRDEPSAEEQLANLRVSYRARGLIIEWLVEQVREDDDSIGQLLDELRASRRQTTRLSEQIADRDSRIEALRDRLSRMGG